MTRITSLHILLLVLVVAVPANTEPNLSIVLPPYGSYPRNIDGATIRTGDNDLSNSTLTLQGGTGTKLKIWFTEWSVSNGVSVKITFPESFESHTLTSLDSSTDSEGPIFHSKNRTVTLKFTVPSNSQKGNNIHIVVTAVQKSSFECDEFKCNNGDCIDKDLKCDGVDHCFDESDEKCGGSRRPFNSGGVVGGVIGAVTGVAVCIGVIVRRQYRIKQAKCNRGVCQPAGGTRIATSHTIAPPPGSYPTQSGVQSGSAPYQVSAQNQAFTYGQGQATGYSNATGSTPDNTRITPGAPPAYETVTGGHNNMAYPEIAFPEKTN